jgi:hypothetical protein
MRRVLPALVAVCALLGVAGCAESGLSSSDLYRIGCPAVDSVAAGGSAANKAAVAGLKKLRDSGQLGADAQKWAVNAIKALESPSGKDLPADTRNVIIKGCHDNGYTLHNLR